MIRNMHINIENTPTKIRGIKMPVENIVLALSYIFTASYYILLAVNLLMF